MSEMPAFLGFCAKSVSDVPPVNLVVQLLQI